ncbi:MAG TPA: OPT/YSL family transporter, partial [Dongiaceae bacterium]|nr:OPT/YSL family transporter [Dongiaceae bacterium]
TWAAVAQALSHGLEALNRVKIWSIIGGGILGIIFALLPVLFPKQQKYLPSAAAFGLAWVFQWYYSLLFLLGAVAAALLQKKSPKNAEEFTFPVASGIIAGGSLMGVLLIFWDNGPAMLEQFWQSVRGLLH